MPQYDLLCKGFMAYLYFNIRNILFYKLSKIKIDDKITFRSHACLTIWPALMLGVLAASSQSARGLFISCSLNPESCVIVIPALPVYPHWYTPSEHPHSRPTCPSAGSSDRPLSPEGWWLSVAAWSPRHPDRGSLFHRWRP